VKLQSGLLSVEAGAKGAFEIRRYGIIFGTDPNSQGITDKSKFKTKKNSGGASFVESTNPDDLEIPAGSNNCCGKTVYVSIYVKRCRSSGSPACQDLFFSKTLEMKCIRCSGSTVVNPMSGNNQCPACV